MKTRTKWILGLTALYLLLVWLLSIAEGGRSDGTIHGFAEALWFFLVTVSTVGYGDMTPVSFLGRLIGLVFVLSSVGVLTAMIGLGLRLIGGKLIPRLRLCLNRGRPWYVFSDCGGDAVTLAEALRREKPDCLLLFPEGEALPLASGNVVRTGPDIPALLRLRKNAEGLYAFFLSPDPWRNFALASDAAARGVMSYCMGNIRPESSSEKLRLFSVAEVVSRRYWDTHPLLASERCVVLIGCGEAGLALLERALLNSVFLEERGIEYHVFGETERFAELHPEIVRALAVPGGDRLFLHQERWTSARALLERADRIILCEDGDGENLAVCDLLKSWYVLRGAVHLRLNTPLLGFVSFGERAEALTPENVMKEELNRRAILMNEIYNEDSPCPTAWEELSPFLRQSNIAAADHLLVKARYLLGDETLSVLTGETCARAYARYRALLPERAELFQETEHRRWLRFHQMYNWQYAPVRDNALRRHPLLLPYDRLSRADQLKDAYAWEMLGRLAEKQ